MVSNATPFLKLPKYISTAAPYKLSEPSYRDALSVKYANLLLLCMMNHKESEEEFHGERNGSAFEVAHQFIESGVILLTAFPFPIDIGKTTAQT